MSPRDRIALLTFVLTATLSATATADWMAEAPREEIKPITSKLDNGHLLIAADDREGLNGGGICDDDRLWDLDVPDAFFARVKRLETLIGEHPTEMASMTSRVEVDADSDSPYRAPEFH